MSKKIERALLLVIPLLLLQGILTGQRGEDYIPFSGDGAWCWFSDPRAVYYEGEHERMYGGWVDKSGNIVVGSYDYATGEIQHTVVYPELEYDDHANPSLLILPDGRIMVFFTKHIGGFYYTKSKKSEDISEFEEVTVKDLGNRLCYTNPVMLSEEDNRIYVFSRGGYDWKPSYVFSDDLGETWSDPQVFVAFKNAGEWDRPYTKVASDGRSAIHFAFTDNHPRDHLLNSIYYMKYEGGRFFDAAGNELGSVGALPVDQKTIPKAYDATATYRRAWIWDIATDEDGFPVMVYATLPEDAMHFYNYARWDGQQWRNYPLGRAGSWFPRFERNKEDREPQPYYSGGIYLDHTDPDIIYLSKPYGDRFEIEKRITPDGGQSWETNRLTYDSDHDNVRPFVIRNCPAGIRPRLLWMNNLEYSTYRSYDSRIMMNVTGHDFSEAMNVEAVAEVASAVAGWQIHNFHRVPHHQFSWHNGALYTGIMNWFEASQDTFYLDWLMKRGLNNRWHPSGSMYVADDFAVSQMYLRMYQLKKNDRMLLPTQARIDWIIENPSDGSMLLNYRDHSTLERWTWCDALYMAPPVYAQLASVTGDKKYLKFMHKEFLVTYDFLYNREDSLFFRDHHYFNVREKNGAHVYWGRGNGWVMGGLVAILKELPEESRYRKFYEQLFLEMAAKVASIQRDDGYWGTSLLDPENFPAPETSGTGFYCFALAWGINEGLLNKDEYIPHVEKAWAALTRAVFPDGKLGWVQPVGMAPVEVTADMSDVYGVGAFLSAASEVYKLSEIDF
jgi:rhamnogalacturonyl hydrolase YesR